MLKAALGELLSASGQFHVHTKCIQSTKKGFRTCMLESEQDVFWWQERILGRAQTSGRVDDNEETITARLANFAMQSLPVWSAVRSTRMYIVPSSCTEAFTSLRC